MKCKTTKIHLSVIGVSLLTLMMIYDKNGNAVYGICAAVFHELGHIIVLYALHDRPLRIDIGVYGMRIERVNRADVSYVHETLIVLAGPAFNLILAFILTVTEFILKADFAVSIKMNLAIGLFNLMPLIPLDGGRAVYYMLCRFSCEDTARKLTKIVTAIGIIPLTVIGIVMILKDTRDYTLLLSSLYVSFALLSFPYS